jgi:hypothetical protein
MQSSINNLFAATKAVLAEKDAVQQHEYEEKLVQHEQVAAAINISVDSAQQQSFALGQIVHCASSPAASSSPFSLASVTALLYHRGSVIVTSSRGDITALNAVTLAHELTATITSPSSSSPLPILCAAIADDRLITAHESGCLYSSPLAGLSCLPPFLTPSLLTAALPAGTAVTSLSCCPPLLHLTTASGQFLSLHLTSLHVVLSLSLSRYALTCQVVENAETVWVGDTAGAVHRLSLTARSVLRLQAGSAGERVRWLMCSPSPVMKKAKKAGGAGGKKGKAKEEEEEAAPEDEQPDVGGPVLLWCAYGAGRLRVWDTRDERNSAVMSFTHVAPEAMSGLMASLSLTSSSGSGQQPSSPQANIAAGLTSPSARSSAVVALPAASSSSCAIHCCLLLPPSTVVTAHEERCIGVLTANIQPTANAGAQRVLAEGEGEQGGAVVLEAAFRDAVRCLLLVPANPLKETEGEKQSEEAEAAAGDAAQHEGKEAVDDGDDEEEAKEQITTPRPTSKQRSAAVIVSSSAIPSSSSSSSCSSSPYLLCGSAAGDVHIFSLPLLEAEVADRRERESKRMDAVIDAWADSRAKAAGKVKAAGQPAAKGEGKSAKGKKAKDSKLTARSEEAKETDSAAVTARD